jgi:hypothetical protein
MIQDHLNKLIGEWQSKGVVVDGGEYDGVTIEGTDRYEWFAENMIVHYADVTFDDVPQRTIEMLQIDEEGFMLTAYNSDGSVETMEGTFDEEGAYRAGNEAFRTVLTFDDENQAMQAVWEVKAGDDWTRWMEMSFAKA